MARVSFLRRGNQPDVNTANHRLAPVAPSRSSQARQTARITALRSTPKCLHALRMHYRAACCS